MSVNSTLHRDFVPELSALTALVNKAINVWRIAPTMEDRLIIESSLIGQFEEMLKISRKIEKLSSTDYLEFYDIRPERKFVEDALEVSAAKLSSLIQMYLDYFNKSQIDLLDIIGTTKRCRQKLATLQLWDRSSSKWLIVEPFLNFDNLDMKYTSVPMANIVTSSGYMTLPVEKKRNIVPSRVKVSSGSNGLAGNSEVTEVVTENRLPQFVTDGNQDTWFEYERLDSGPCLLNLQLFLPKVDICNGLVIEGMNLGDSINYRIEDILFLKGDGQTVSISKMISPDLPKDFFTIKTIGNETFWEIAFMPIKASSITIKFIQEHSYPIEMMTLGGRKVHRDRYAIGIRKIKVFKNKFSPEGGINCLPQYVPNGMYGAACTSQVWPRRTNLYDISMNISADEGETWDVDMLDLPEVEGETALLDGRDFQCLWSLSLKRKDNAFKEALSFSDEEPNLSIESMQDVVSVNQSPAVFKINGKAFDKKVVVLQPNLCKRSSNISDAIPFGLTSFLGSDNSKRFALPFSLIEEKVDPNDLRIFVNGQEWTRVLEANTDISPANGGLGWGTYFLNRKQTSVEFFPSNEAPVGAFLGNTPLLTVTFMLREEKLSFWERSDGFYSKFSQLFDPDKQNVKITRLPKTFTKANLIIPKGVKEISLGVKYIKEIIFLGISPVERPGPAVLSPASANLEYFIDKINGILFLNRSIKTSASVNVEHFTPSVLSDNSYEVWVQDSKPVGVIISSEAMATSDREDLLYTTNASRQCPENVLNIKTGAWEAREDLFLNNSKAFTLSEDKIIRGSVRLSSEVFGYKDYPPPSEEVYLDGNSEFMGLKSMDVESTPRTDADIEGFVSFKLAAGRNFYPNFEPVFREENRSGAVTFNATERKYRTAAALRTAILQEGMLAPAEDGTVTIDNTIMSAWVLEPDGLVTVFIGRDKVLSGDINISYYYTDPNFDRKNRFSVDYDNGILFLSEELDQTETRSVFYKTANYITSYSLSKEVNSYSFDNASNTVTVRTENLSKVNNKIKILWSKAPESSSLDELKDYFSPIVYRVGVRFQ